MNEKSPINHGQGLANRGYGFGYIIIVLFFFQAGDGIRYRYKYCLYSAMVLFLVLSCNFLFRLLAHHTSYLTLRFVLCAWVSFRLIPAFSSMHELIATNTFPDRDNRFMRFLLRKKHS